MPAKEDEVTEYFHYPHGRCVGVVPGTSPRQVQAFRCSPNIARMES